MSTSNLPTTISSNTASVLLSAENLLAEGSGFQAVKLFTSLLEAEVPAIAARAHLGIARSLAYANRSKEAAAHYTACYEKLFDSLKADSAEAEWNLVVESSFELGTLVQCDAGLTEEFHLKNGATLSDRVIERALKFEREDILCANLMCLGVQAIEWAISAANTQALIAIAERHHTGERGPQLREAIEILRASIDKRQEYFEAYTAKLQGVCERLAQDAAQERWRPRLLLHLGYGMYASGNGRAQIDLFHQMIPLLETHITPGISVAWCDGLFRYLCASVHTRPELIGPLTALQKTQFISLPIVIEALMREWCHGTEKREEVLASLTTDQATIYQDWFSRTPDWILNNCDDVAGVPYEAKSHFFLIMAAEMVVKQEPLRWANYAARAINEGLTDKVTGAVLIDTALMVLLKSQELPREYVDALIDEIECTWGATRKDRSIDSSFLSVKCLLAGVALTCTSPIVVDGSGRYVELLNRFTRELVRWRELTEDALDGLAHAIQLFAKGITPYATHPTRLSDTDVDAEDLLKRCIAVLEFDRGIYVDEENGPVHETLFRLDTLEVLRLCYLSLNDEDGANAQSARRNELRKRLNARFLR